ncbi:MAG TPA: FAD-dependent oxidoreductase [Candidatus Excrementavichristensenella intestinipullorum]|nr:FAD-dependent oxidoreductase [Candidatus Excrementavichristensenella intestinipullorum]
MKRIVSMLLCVAMLCTLSCWAMAETVFTPGTYEGEGTGFQGPIKVSVTVSDTAIEQIQVLEQSETAGISDPAFEKIPALILEHQSVAVDAVAGCTNSSRGLIEAVKAALLAAGATEEMISKEIAAQEAGELETQTADVVIIGAGGAGMTAAVEALRAGGSVLIVEKMAAVGGNTIAAGSALNAAGSDIQKTGTMAASGVEAIEEKLALEPQCDAMKRWQESVRQDLDAYIASGSNQVFDTPDLHKLQTYVDGDYVGKPELIEILCDNAPKALTFLEDLGMSWKPQITTAVGATWSRSHQPANVFGGAGSDFVLPQYEFVKANGGVVALEHKAEELMVEDGRVVGVKGVASNGTPFEFRANKSVILATGGFSANVEMRMKYNKFWANLDETVPTSNQPCATGDGITMAEAIGANLYGMEWIQMVPAGDASLNASIANEMYINADGNRFIAEDERRDVLSGAILAQPGSFCWKVSSAYQAWDIQGGYDYKGNPIESLVANGKAVVGDTLDELAQAMGVNADNLKAAALAFDKAVAGEEPDALGRKVFEYKMDKGPYYATKSYAKVHHTMGGVEINTDCQVLDTQGNVIPGLYACGEVTGGIHGSNRLGGNAIADIIVFGQIAGQNAMK